MTKICLVYTTLSPLTAAQTLAHKLIGEGLAVCCNIITSGQSIYQWEGQVVQEEECFLLFKTTCTNKERLMNRLNALHPYKSPALLALEAEASQAFFDYVTSKDT